MALMVLRTCQQIEGGLPNAIKAKMVFNIMLDFGIGLVPILGDIADALFRANTRNAIELEKYLREQGLKNLKAQGQSTPPIDPTDPDVFDEQMRQELGPPPQYSSVTHTRQGTLNGSDNSNSKARSAMPQQQTMPEQRSGGGLFGSKKKQPDLERGSDRGNNSIPLTNSRHDEPRRPAGTLQKNRY
jgi:hypothetical protein